MAKKEFNVTKVALKGSNLIEASAGTGKTYSIAILVIRLIIEKRIELKEILMVTFTNAAVAELELRIRKFIREAYAFIEQGADIDSTIKEIIDNALKNEDKETIVELLSNARRQLDETSIFTIHSFCQKSLNEFAFETGQAFNCEVLEDESDFIVDVVNQYWREKVTTLDTELLTVLLKADLSKGMLAKVIKKVRQGKEYIYDKETSIADFMNLKTLKEKEIVKAIDNFNTTFMQSPERTLDHIGNKGPAFNGFSHLIDNPEEFRIRLIQRQSSQYVPKTFPTLLGLSLRINELKAELPTIANNCISSIYGSAIPFCNNNIQKKKREQSLFSFDDLINKFHGSITSESLQNCIRKQYKAVFIDEFQDTDQKQYEIFNTLFNGYSILFYIGDPKQSIYSFKGTDLDTYLDAADKVDFAYTMSSNYRSTKGYIDAMNTLFSGVENPFFDNRIAYEEVNAGLSLPEMSKGNNPVVPLSLYNCNKENELIEHTTNYVKSLLMDGYMIDGRKVKPSDIGILVRANKKGAKIKNALSSVNIPAITIDDSKVIESEQSTLLLYTLKAIYEPNVYTINRALLTYFTNKTKDDLLSNKIESDVEFFKNLGQVWVEKGIFCAINLFMDKYQTLDNIHNNKTFDAERVSTNLLQLNELLHNKEQQSKLPPKGLITWLENSISGAEDGGEYTQRLESDEDAVKIVTIHKSKGLAYNIVIAPYLDLKSDHNTKWDFIEYKDTETGKYCFSSQITQRANDFHKEQTERENRRLIYVALTRAVYKAIIIHKSKDKCGIKTFIDAAQAQNTYYYEPHLESDNRIYNERKTKVTKTPKEFSSTMVNSSWNNFSFSMLSEYAPHLHSATIELSDEYEKFIFEEFPKGTLAGNFMHYLFENTDFTTDNFNRGIKKALDRYNSVFNPDDDKLLESQLESMLDHVLNTNIPTQNPFKLSQVKPESKLVEMGFDYKINKFSTNQLQKLIPNLNLARKGEIEGMMTGFIDLLFEHEGKFYILDWKSNYLGNTLESYSSEMLEKAIQESNYHLQYLIYTVATKLYLENCLPNFDYDSMFGGVIYVYARGCRKGSNSGVYFSKPEKELVEELEGVMI